MAFACSLSGMILSVAISLLGSIWVGIYYGHQLT
jgi:hypothetical protein